MLHCSSLDISPTMTPTMTGSPSIFHEAFEMMITASLFVVGWLVFRWLSELRVRKAAGGRKVSVSACKADEAEEAFAESTEETTPATEKEADMSPQKTSSLPVAKSDDDFAAVYHGQSEAIDDWGDLYGQDETLTHCPSDDSDAQGAPLWPEEEEDSAKPSPCPASAVEADVGSALEVALVSGDAALADSVLSAGSRLCGAVWVSKALGRLQGAGVAVSQDRAVELSQVFVSERRPDLAVDLWLNRCTEAGREPSSEPTPEPELYTAVLEGCAAIGDFETASRVARSAAWRAPQDSYPGQQSMLALSRWLARRRAVSPALECYESVRRATGAWSGDRGAPDLTTHKAVLKACISSNDMMRAEILFHDLMSSQCSPDFGIFAAMIRGHRAAGRPEEAMSYFELMKRHGIRPDSSLFDVVLDCCCWKDVPSLVERVLADMEAAGVEPSSGTLATVLRLYGQSCKIDKALEAFEELPKRHGLQVDSRAYGAMITTCLQGGRLDLALETFDRMSAAGCRAKARTYEALLRACTRRGDLDRAVRLVDEALCLQEAPAAPETTTDQQPRRPRAHIEPGHVEELLRLLGKRGEAARLGAPLAARLRRAGCEVPEDLEASLVREAARQQSAQSPTVSPIYRRREVHTRWRDFQVA